MAKFTRNSLSKFRRERQEASQREGKGLINIVVGMGTCGIAAGAKDALNVFLGEAYTRKMNNIKVRQTGCMGLCHAEPTVRNTDGGYAGYPVRQGGRASC